MSADRNPFWEKKKLAEMSKEEWEALCDGCGKCCLHKLEDIDTGQIKYTNVACSLLDLRTIRCSDYPNRHRFVPDCIQMKAETVRSYKWLPKSCAYRRLDEGKPLPEWHPLITGNPKSTLTSGNSVLGQAISETKAGPLEKHINNKLGR